MPTTKVDPAPRRDNRSDRRMERGDGTDQHRLAGVVRSLRGVPSRRDVLRGLATAGLSLSLATLPTLAEAKPTRRKKRRQPKPAKPNQYGCLEVSDPCRRHTQCCSGRCTGKPGRKRCRAHGTGTCNQASLAVCESAGPAYALCNNSKTCVCTRTTAGSSFCGDLSLPSGCATCKRDADCVTLGLPPGSACAPFAFGACVGACPTGMICLAPCGYEPPPPAP